MRSIAVGYDVSEERVRRLQEGETFIEDISNGEIRTAQNSGRYTATTRTEDCHNFDVAVITVPTPLRESVPDLSFIEDAAHKLGQNLTKGATVILQSTTYPGTTEELVSFPRKSRHGLCGVLLFSSQR